jgi:signal transduction histidine kinase
MVSAVLFLAPLSIAIVVSLLLSIYVGTSSRLRVRALFVILCLEVVFLAATYWMELISTTLSGKLFWNDLEYIVNVTVPPFFLFFVATFLGRKIITGWRRALLFIVPTIMLLLVWTNDFHHLFYTAVWLDGNGLYTTFGHTYGIGFAIHTLYSMGLLFYSVGLLIYYYISSSPMQKRQVRLVLVAAFIPIIALPMGLLGISPVSLTYLSVIGFATGLFLIFLGTFMYELFDIVPLASEKILETVDDGVIVVTIGNRIVFTNRIITEITNISGSDLYARPLTVISPDLSLQNVERARSGSRVEITLGKQVNRLFLLKATPLLDREGTTTAVLLTLRDITDERNISESLKEANVKLNLLSSITRHDILNQLTVIKGAGELMQEGGTDEEHIRRYGEKITKAAETIEKQFGFARDYQNLGVQEPEWQRVDQVLERATSLGLASGIKIDAELDDYEVLADPLIDRVFSSLLDNTMRHGRNATTVWAFAVKKDGRLLVFYEDDGIGIPDGDKEKIFERGFGHSGGLGLFLARQILDVNETSIQEKGKYGEGALFEIAFPAQRWRENTVEHRN